MTKIVFLSDTHNKHKKLCVPDGDILIHSGDFTNTGRWDEVLSFVNWFSKLPHKHKILIAGNHEITLDIPFYDENWKFFHKKKQDLLKINNLIRNNPNFYYLENTFVIIEGIKIYGSPYVPSDQNYWAFEYKHDLEADSIWSKIPKDTDILVTHTPPFGCLDFYQKHLGCDILLLYVSEKIKPKYHLFGHIHDAYGIIKSENTTFINGAIVDGNLRPKYNIVSFFY